MGVAIMVVCIVFWLLMKAIPTPDFVKEAEAQDRLKRYQEAHEMKGGKFCNPASQAVLKQFFIAGGKDYSGTYTKEYVNNLLGYEVDYKKASYNFYGLMAEVAEKEGWIMIPPGKTWQEMEPGRFIALWGWKSYDLWRKQHGLPHYNGPWF